MKLEVEIKRRQRIAEETRISRIERANRVRSTGLRPEAHAMHMADLAQDADVGRRERLEVTHDHDCVIVTHGDLQLRNRTCHAQSIDRAPENTKQCSDRMRQNPAGLHVRNPRRAALAKTNERAALTRNRAHANPRLSPIALRRAREIVEPAIRGGNVRVLE